VTALARLSLRFRTVTLLLVGLLLAGGAWSATRLNQELFPSLEVPYLVVSGVEPGAGPNAVAANLTAPIEEAIGGTDDLRHVASTSVEGVAVVTAEYDFGTDMDARQSQVRELLAAAQLPEGVALPEVQRISPDSFPIYSVAVSGADDVALDDFVTETLAPVLARQPGVGELTVAGGATEVVTIAVDPVRLAAAGLSRTDVTAALRSAELSVPVGGIAADGTQFPVRVATSLRDLDQLEALPVVPQGPGAEPVALGEVATVARGEGGAGQTVSRLDGRPAITVEVLKAQGANTVSTVNAVEDALAGVARPAGIEVEEVVNQAPEITKSVSDLATDALLGVVLAVAAILVFLRSVRGTLVTGVSIPLSLLVAFIIMNINGITLNILTLGALSVAAARVIDDAIVVFENIHRLLDEGYERSEAVITGTSQMVPAITASTLTTVAVFLPLAFVGGLVGEVFVGFALTVTFALLASLVVAVTVIPVLAETFLKPTHRPGEVSSDAGDVQETRMKAAYRRPLVWALTHRAATVGVAVVLLVASLATTVAIPVTLFPASPTETLSVSLAAPPGTSLAETADRVADLEAGLVDLAGVERVATVVGTTDNPLAALVGGGSGGSSSATVTVDLADDADIDTLTAGIEARIDDTDLRGAVTEQGGDAGPSSTNVSVQVTGADFDQVAAATDTVRDAIAGVDGVEEVTSNVAGERPELVVAVDAAAAAHAGLDATTVATAVRAALTPTPVTAITLNGETSQVIVVTDPAAVADAAALTALPLGPGTVLGDVATVEQAASPTAITRYDLDRSAEVTGVITDDNLGAVNADIAAVLDDLDLPPGVGASQGGAAELQDDSFASLLTAMVIAVALVYLCMVATFGSLLTPFVILLSLPLAAIGAFPALLITGRELGLPAMLGLLMLIGIVVTNAIVMLEFVERLRRERALSSFDALVEGAQTRLRPILMTAIVTVLALVPLALGLSDGAVLSASLATVVIGGLLSSTLLTLLVIPAVYSLFDGLKDRVTRARDARPPRDDTVLDDQLAPT